MVTVICTFEIVIFLRIILKLIQNDRSEEEIKKIFSEYCYFKNPVIQHSLDFVYFIELRGDLFLKFLIFEIKARFFFLFYILKYFKMFKEILL